MTREVKWDEMLYRWNRWNNYDNIQLDGQMQRTCETERMWRMNATRRPSRTSWLQNVPRKYGFIANVMSAPVNAYRPHTDTYTQTDRQTYDVIVNAISAPTNAQITHRYTDRHICRYTQKDRQTNGQTDKHLATDNQTLPVKEYFAIFSVDMWESYNAADRSREFVHQFFQ